ncbi:MAG: cupin domain-containing protein [Thermoanaerobaculum sp.]|nr:cupin domain-containing protein [Thermoanaerobaculum sp.]
MEKARIVHPGEVQPQPVARARGALMAVLLGPELGVPHFVTRKFFLAPGGRIPAHSHPDLEHEQVVLRGEMVIGLDGQEHTVRAGDAVFIPAGCQHWYENRSSEPVEFLCVVPKTERYVTQWHEDPPAGAFTP